jgi:N-acetylmuramoyl-L-alanine amidase
MIILDAGHGGFDPGGGSNIYFKEKDLAKKITDYEARRLNELGIKTIVVRENDETLTPSQRIARISSLGAKSDDILISNHINTGGSAGGEVIYSIRGSSELPKLIADELYQAGLPIRNVYKRMGSSGRDFYFILRDTKPNIAMIIEYGFADNEEDTNRLLYNWPNLAEAVIRAICIYLGVNYTSPKEVLYIVKPNDSLFQIAKKFNTTVEAIKKRNGLTSDRIEPLAELTIPS